MEITLDRVIINPIWKCLCWVIETLAFAINKVAVTPFRREILSAEAQRYVAERYMHEYGNTILRLAYMYVHSMEDAEDILQDTLIKVIEANPKFENENHEKAYVLKTASNMAKNRIKPESVKFSFKI